MGYSPFPVGFEIMQGTADIGFGVITNRVDPGVFAISLKVPDLEESIEEMKELGHACAWEGAFGGIS